MEPFGWIAERIGAGLFAVLEFMWTRWFTVRAS
jgi:hypothetical protein